MIYIMFILLFFTIIEVMTPKNAKYLLEIGPLLFYYCFLEFLGLLLLLSFFSFKDFPIYCNFEVY